MKQAIVSGLVYILLAPIVVFASFEDSKSAAQAQVAAFSQQQLENLNTRVFSDAFLTAKIIGFDRSEIDQLKSDVRALQNENAQLRSQLNRSSGISSVAPAASSSLETRVAYLETALTGLQKTLGLVVNMLTLVLSKL